MRSNIIAVVFCLLVAPAEAQLLKLRRTDLGNGQANLIESLSLKGDLRLRHESIARRSAGRSRSIKATAATGLELCSASSMYWN